MSSNSHKIAKAAGILMLAILLSRILGFVREAVMGMQFGSNWMTDAYIAAFTIPDLVYYLLIGGALSAAFIPVFTDYIMKDEIEEAWKVASIVMNIVVVALGTIIILGMIFADYLVPLVALNFRGETLQLTIFLTRIMFPAVLFHALNGLAMGVLNSFDHFTVPAFGSVVYNTVIILAIIFLGPKLGIMGMSIGVVLGAAATTLMQYLALRRRGISYYFKIDLHHPGVRRIGSLMLPAVIGLSIVQINLVINQNFASFLSEGSITALRFANRLIQLPYGLFASAIGIAIFPTLTKLAAKDRWEDMTGTLSEGLRLTNFLCIPAGAGLMALSVPIVRLLFEQGKFDEQATYATAVALFFYGIGVFAQCGTAVATRGFYALKDTILPLKIGIITVICNVILNFMLIAPLQHGGLALAFSLSGILNFVLLLVCLRKKMGKIDGRNLTISFVKCIILSCIMGAVCWWTAEFLADFLDLGTKLGQLLQVGISVSCGAGIYLVLAYLFNMEELYSMLKMVFKH